MREFTASDGYRLRYRHWPSRETPRGSVVALHGIQSHGGWFEHSSRRMAEAGYEVFFLDRRGSGLNERERGHAAHADRLVNDVVQFLWRVRFRRPGRPVVLLGLSWGGKLAAVVCARRPELVDALALLYPGICARVRPRPNQRVRLRIAAWLGLHRRRVPIPLGDPALFTGQPEWQQFIREDRLALHQATIGLLQASVDLDAEVAKVPERIDCPVLLMLAGRDRIIDNRATRQWFQRLGTADGHVIEFPQAQHTLEFEPNRDAIIDGLLAWLGTV